MSSFSSKASLVGLGESGNQRFSLGRAATGDVEVRPDAGQVTLYLEKDGGSREELNSTSLGAVVYRSDETEIAYQGGGVWQRRGESSWMISPPEYHYQLETLTFPIMTVDGDGHASGGVRGTVRSTGESEDWFPIRGNESRSNPLEEGTVLVEVESRYCAGWEAFFTERSEGAIADSCGGDDTVTVDLTVPFSISGENAVMAKDINNGGDIPENWREGVVAPSASSEVESRLDSCESGSCAELDDQDTVTSGDYWVSEGYTFDGTTFNTTGGDISVVSKGDAELKDLSIKGDHNVTLYVRDDLKVGGGSKINDGGDPRQMMTLVHSSGDVEFKGGSSYTGVLYAAKSDVTLRGSPSETYVGVIVAENLTPKGNLKNFDYQSAEELEEFQLLGGDRPLTYLHVTENTVETEFD
jgi:hypothetical protein